MNGAPRFRAVLLVCGPAVLVLAGSTEVTAQTYEEVSLEAGIDHSSLDSDRMCAGAVWFDYDGDGWEDLFLTGGEWTDHLYRNRGDGTFEDVTEESGIARFADRVTCGAVAGDLDGDGDRDLFVTTKYDETNLLLRNEGDGTFVDGTEEAGVAGPGVWSTAATLGDYDRDGDLDLYVGNYARFDDKPFDENLVGGIPNLLYRNRGDGTFEEVSEALGVRDPGGLTLVATFTDYDGDGDPDLMVANDFGYLFEPNALFRNDFPEERFTDVGEESRLDAEINAMGIATGDYDEDGGLDYYLTNMSSNRFFRRGEDGRFVEIAGEKGLQDRYSTGWGATFLDYDNDCDLDLLYANGRVLPSYSMEELDNAYRLIQSHDNRLFRSDGRGSFAEVTYEEGVADSTRGRGLAVADYDHDGDLDYVVAGMRQTPDGIDRAHLYRNRGHERHWLELELIGPPGNPDAYGARVTAWMGGRRFVREVQAGASYLSQHASAVHFGLGEHPAADSLVVAWPGGERQRLEDPEADRRVVVEHPGARSSSPGRAEGGVRPGAAGEEPKVASPATPF